MIKMNPESLIGGLERIAGLGLIIGALVVGANVLLRGSNKNEKPESKKNR